MDLIKKHTLTCSECSGPTFKAIYLGAPFYLCESERCGNGWGLGAWLGSVLFFNGRLLKYEGSYWHALWVWLWT